MVELADIFRSAGESYQQAYGDRMLPSHRRAMADIIDCRTPALGGSLFVCDTCGGLDYAYHSCRNRHCPKCHYGPSQLWLEGLRDRLLPCSYYFVTFTLPAELRPLARSHQGTVYDLLLREAAAALQLLADDPKWVGAKLGILAVLHTWARDLSYHPHVHLLATAGGLADQGETWRKPARPRFLVPGYALSTIFRAKVRDALDRENLLAQVEPTIFRKSWNVHLEHAGDGEHAAEYLSRYVHRVAITNDRIEAFDHGRVTFRYVDSRTQQTRRLTLPVHAFIARFLQHVLPKGFQKIRGYGLFRPADTRQRQRARHLLELDPALPQPPKNSPATSQPDGDTLDLDRRRLCPACRRGHLIRLRTSHRPPPLSLCTDTIRAPPS
ncbi:MAG TPA: IS91 family transposase [Methylomirabilota bacterium]